MIEAVAGAALRRIGRWLMVGVGGVLAGVVAQPAAAEFCADLQARYSGGIMRCVDFANAQEAAVNPSPNAGYYGGTTGIDTRLFNPAASATPGATGSLYWKIRSYDQVRAEEPGLSRGAAWVKALDSHTGNWQRWIGVDQLTPGQTYYYQFKLRFNPAYKTWWGGGGMKVFGMDAGCRTVNGVSIPPVCEQYSGNHVTDLGTATSMEFGTMTTTNWFPAAMATAANRPYPVLYQGSSNFALTQGFAPLVSTPFGTAQQEQAGPDAGDCNGLARLNNPDFVSNGPCVTYGAPNVWHEITIALKPSGNFYDSNPALSGKLLRHDTLLKVWYDGQLIFNFDPNEAPFKNGQASAASCAANQQGNDGSRLVDPHPSYDVCRTGVDILKDSRDVPPNSGWCVYSCGPNDPGADLTQFILWTFSYTRGYPPSDHAWCDTELGRNDAAYGLCVALSGSGPNPADRGSMLPSDPGRFDAFLHHAQVDVFMDDWVVSTVPLPMQKRAAGARLGAGAFGLDARDVDMLPPNTWQRLYPGPDKTFYNTGYGTLPASDVYSPGTTQLATLTAGVNNLSATNYGIEIPVQIGVPLGGGFVGTPWGNGKMLYFGGGHSGYRANRVNVFDLKTGRWSQSKYTPDMGSQITGAIGPRTPTPPGTGCTTEPFTQPSANGATTYFATTGNLTAGSAVVTGLGSVNNMCPINGTCPGQGALVGGYAIKGSGIPSGAVIKSVDSASQVTLTHAATLSASGVALTGGRAECSAGGAPNGSAGGRGWWEHMDDRYAWDPRANAWMLVQNSGTWLYDDVSETWKLATGPYPGSASLMCSPGDYTAMGIRFSSALNSMLNWCSTNAIFKFDYGSGAPNFTGARWVPIHQLATADQNPNTDVLAQTVWDPVKNRLYHITQRSTSFYGGSGQWDPIINWFDPFAAPSCATNAFPCGRSGKLDSSKANFPQGYSSPRDPITFAPNTGICWTTVCQQVTASIAADGAGSLYVVGRRAGDAQIILWKLTDPLGPNEAWTVLQNFNFNTYDNAGLKLWTDGQSPADTVNHEFSLASSTMSLLTYVPERDMFFLVTRSGSGEGGASTRGTGSANNGGCYLNGLPDDCFRMYGFRLDGSIITTGGGPVAPPTPNGDTTAPSVAIAAPTGGNVSGAVTVQMTASDDTGIAHVDLYINGVLAGTSSQPPYAYSWNTTTSPNGTVQLLARAFDVAGNVGTSSTVTVNISNGGGGTPTPPTPPTPTPPTPTPPNTVMPSVAITSPTSGSVSGVVPVSVNAIASLGIAHVDLYINGAFTGTNPTPPYAFAWDSATSPNGAVQLLAKVIDTAGNVGTSSTVTLNIANGGGTPNPPNAAAPSVAIASPTGGSVSGVVPVSVTASAAAGVLGVELYVDGTMVGTANAPPYTFSWNSATRAAGSALLTAKAYDANGNVGTSSVVTVNVTTAAGGTTPAAADLIAPTVAIVPPDGRNVAGTVPVQVTASDNVAVVKVELYANGALVGTATSAPFDFQWDTTSLPNGLVRLTAKAYDAAGNMGTSKAVSVHVGNLSLALSPPGTFNYEGLWWGAPAGIESGWGINLAHQGDVIFATWFTYDANGKAWWLSMTANKIGNNAYSGTLYQTYGPAFSAVPFDPRAVMPSVVGTGTLTFSGGDNATFAYNVNGISQTKAITRQVFGPVPTCVFGGLNDLTLASNYQDLWWAAPAASESGWGVNLTHQGDVIFATWFTYDVDSTPVWFSAVAPWQSPGVYAGTLDRTTGPAFSATPFNPSMVARTTAGSMTLKFDDGDNADFSYAINGVTQTKRIKRQVFRNPGTACVQPVGAFGS